MEYFRIACPMFYAHCHLGRREGGGAGMDQIRGFAAGENQLATA
jgi:hypothetical protein